MPIGIPSRVLSGLSRETAERFGKPHVSAFYAASSVSSNRLAEGASCAICDRPATNSHHEPPRSKGAFALPTPKGVFVLKPALIALCGSGTTGCHGAVHSGIFRIRWVWDSEEAERAWWDGSILSKSAPHDPALYGFGHWEILGPQGVKEVRE